MSDRTWPVDDSLNIPTTDDSAAAKSPPLYLVVAHRWGQTNNHFYFVYIGPSRGRALRQARTETEERGGKYGCAVLEFIEHDDYQLIAYFPSIMEDKDADRPTHNHRVDYLIRLGGFLDEACKGAVYLPVEGDTEGVMGNKHTLVEVPQYMKDEQARAHARLQQWERIDEEVKARRQEAKQ